MDFNKYQSEAIKCDSSAACIATAGSGKTTVLVERVYRLTQLVPPERILCIAFSNAAVDNMKLRLANRDKSLKSVMVSTLHSAALGCIKRSGLSPVVVTEKYGKVDFKTGKIEKYGLVDIMMPIVHKYEMESNSHNDDFPEAMLRYVGLRLSKMSNDIKGFEDYFEPAYLEKVYKDFLNYMESHNLISFDMMCWKAINLLKTNDDLRDYVQSKYDYVFIDECQDLSGDQYELAKLIAAKCNIFMVGDGLQNIYSFKGGDSKYLLKAHKEFDGMKVIHLPINYRCSEKIIETSNKIARITEEAEDENYMDAIAFRKGGTMPVVTDGYGTVPMILLKQKELVGDWSEIAVLARTNSVLLSLKSSFYKYKIPCYFNGKDGIPREIKLMCEYLKLIADTSDDKAFLKVINNPKRYIGKATLSKIEETARKRKLSLFDATMYAIYPKDRCYNNALDFIEGIEYVRDYKYKNAASALRGLIKELGISKAIKDMNKGNEDAYLDAMDNIESMVEEAKEYKDIREFAKNYIDFINATDEGGVVLSTVHKSKGLEWKSVIIAGFNDGLFPHKRNDNIYEEIHILYVAATRAKDYLFFVQDSRNEESPFLEVMGDTVEIVPNKFFKNS